MLEIITPKQGKKNSFALINIRIPIFVFLVSANAKAHLPKKFVWVKKIIKIFFSGVIVFCGEVSQLIIVLLLF